MIERVAERAVTVEGVTARQPLNFQLYYADNNGRATIINTLYLEDGNSKLDLYLIVFNESSGNITFKAPPPAKLSQVGGSDSASAEKCHFSLRLEKDIQIRPSEISVEPQNEWQVNYSENDQFITIYFLSKKELVLQRKAPDNDSDTVRLTLKNLAAYNGTIKSSNVELTYGSSLLLNSKGQEVSPISSKNAISVTNHPDHRDIPLQFRFIGPNSILNDGTTENSLKLQIINRPPSNNTRPNLLLDKANSKFLVSFEIGTGAEALTTEERVKAIKLTTTNTTKWKAVKLQNATEGTVNLQDNTQPINQKLGSGEVIELEIKDIKTNNPSGVSYMYIAYQNIVGYPDGRLVVPIEKTPLLYRGTQVGIGTKDPSEKLHVVGDLVLGKNDNNKKFIFHSRTSNNNDHLQITSDNSEGRWAWGQGITLKRDGNVGIGTETPSAKLHVQGGDAIISGKLAIGTPTPKIHLAIGDDDTGLKQAGENKLAIYTNNLERVLIDENGNVGIGTPTPKIHLAIGDDDTGLKQAGENKLAIYTNNAERVLIDEAGNVGIGTTTPKIHLAIGDDDTGLKQAGENKLAIYTNNAERVLIDEAGNVGIGTTTPKIHLAIGDDDTGLKQAGENKLAIYTNNAERVLIDENGNVGIGTTTPSAILDVNGSVKLGASSTTWNRIICGKVIIIGVDWKCYGKGISKCLRANTGHFIIEFEQSVEPQKMVITVSTEYEFADNFVSVVGITNSNFAVKTRDKTGMDEDNSFHFIAIELSENLYKSVMR